MDNNNHLLEKFLTEGMSSMRALKDQNDAIQKDMTDIKISTSTIREQIVNLTNSFSKGQQMLERDNEELRRRVTDQEKTLIFMDKKLITLESDGGRQAVDKLGLKLDNLDTRISVTETQQNKWLGALAVIVIIVGFGLGLFKAWIVP